MKYVVFKNKGVIDTKSITTFGVSSKENASAIGYFGTGLKYAIAIILRESNTIKILAGKSKALEFGTRRGKIRVDEFEFVTMNKRALGFTTEVGKSWEIWQAFRELYCNCIDEFGEVFVTDEEPEPIQGYTLVVVTGEAFYDIWCDRSSIILDSSPIEKHDSVNIHPGPSSHVYYRGVRAYKLDHPSIHTYDIQRRVDLTEDRTIKWSWDIDSCVQRGLTKSENNKTIEKAVTATKNSLEARLSYDGIEPSKEFLGVVTKLARDFNPDLNNSALKSAQLWAMNQMHSEAKPMKLSDLENLRMDKAIEFCAAIGFSIDDYPLIVSEFLGEEVLGRAHEGKIYISKRVLMMGTKMLAGTLIEEFIHLRHSLHDETRTMQNFLMDTIVSLGEQVIGEPL